MRQDQRQQKRGEKMKIDELGSLITDEDYPGCVGDSCANTARHFIFDRFNPPKFRAAINLRSFRTEAGYVRHALAPSGPPVSRDNWREPSFTSDQAMPLIMALDLSGDDFFYREIKRRCLFVTAPWKISSPGVFALCAGLHWFLFFISLFQVLIFRFPYRWSDDNRMSGRIFKFERSESSSADYLNFIATAAWFNLKGMKWRGFLLLHFAGENTCRLKVMDYFRNEPNSDWIIRAYFNATHYTMEV